MSGHPQDMERCLRQAPFPGVAELEREGAALVVALEAAGQLHRRHRFVYAAAPDLRVGHPADLLVLCCLSTRGSSTEVLWPMRFAACSCHAWQDTCVLFLPSCA